MPVMERAASRDSQTICYQCPRCSFVVRRPLNRRMEFGGRVYDERIACPRCLANGVQTPPEEQ